MARYPHHKSLGDIDIRLVRIFVTVTEAGGFAAAVPELNIGRSTISKHIAEFEMRIGLKLCNRGPAGFSLTSEGQRILRSARKLMSSIDVFQSSVDDIHANLAGTLRLGLCDNSSTNPKAHIDAAIRQFDRVAPEVTMEIHIESPSGIEAHVIDGTMDIAIVPLHRQSGSLTYDTLYEEEMTLYCGAGHPLFETATTFEPASLDAHKYAGFGFNSPNMKAGQALGLRRAARVQDDKALSLLVQSGIYLGYLADHAAQGLVDEGLLCAVAPERTRHRTSFAAITRSQPEPDRKTLTFLGCLRAAHAS